MNLEDLEVKNVRKSRKKVGKKKKKSENDLGMSKPKRLNHVALSGVHVLDIEELFSSLA